MTKSYSWKFAVWKSWIAKIFTVSISGSSFWMRLASIFEVPMPVGHTTTASICTRSSFINKAEPK